MDLVRFVFSLDILSLEFSVFDHLSDGLSILLLDGEDLLLAVFNLVKLLFHAGLVLLLLGLNFLLMLATLHVHLIIEDLAALVFTSLKLLEEGRVFQHFGTVFVTLLLHLRLLLIK